MESSRRLKCMLRNKRFVKYITKVLLYTNFNTSNYFLNYHFIISAFDNQTLCIEMLKDCILK